MVARVVHVELDPTKVDEAARLYQESVVPAAAEEAGFMGAMLLTRADGRAISIDLCDTLEHMQENERNGFYQRQVAKFAEHLTGRPRRDFYDVSASTGVHDELDTSGASTRGLMWVQRPS